MFEEHALVLEGWYRFILCPAESNMAASRLSNTEIPLSIYVPNCQAYFELICSTNLLSSLVQKVYPICELMAIVPGIQNLFLGIVVNLGGEGVLIGEGEAWNGFSVSVSVISIVHFAVFLVVHIDGIQDATDDEAVSVRVPLKTCPVGGFLFQG